MVWFEFDMKTSDPVPSPKVPVMLGFAREPFPGSCLGSSREGYWDGRNFRLTAGDILCTASVVCWAATPTPPVARGRFIDEWALDARRYGAA